MIEKVTLKDIARDTGLSISTVSRALSQTGKISRENATKVFESANRLNYPLAAIHTPLEHRDKINIALVTRHFTGEFYSSLYAGFDLATKEKTASISLMSVTHSSVPVLKVLTDLKKNRYDAAILFLPELKSADYYELLERLPSDFPVVSIAPLANPVLDTVTFDHYRGGYLVARHFEERGFRKVGMILGPVHQSEAMLRKNGFLDYVQSSEQMTLEWQCHGDFSFQSGRSAYDEYKSQSDRPEAIFCSNDSMALGFMHGALRDSVHVPGEVALAGFDDLPVTTLYTPTITSVHTPYELLGKKTLELIFNRLEKRTDEHHIGYTNLVPVSLNVRESTMELDQAFQIYSQSVTK